jgi:hypothetical protein
MDASASLGGFFIGGDSTGDGFVELAGDQMKLRFNPNGADTVDLYHDGASLSWKSSATTEAYRWYDSSGVNRFLFQVSTTTASNLFDLKKGGTLRLFNEDNADHVQMSHDGTDFRLQDGSGTTDFRVTGMNISLETDNLAFYFGSSKDVGMYYNGTDLIQKNFVSATSYHKWVNNSGASIFQMEFSATASSNILEVRAGGQFAIQDSTNSDWVRMRHDGTDFNFASTGTTQYTFDKGILVSGHVRCDNYIRWVDSEVTISSGAVTVTRTRHKVDTQSDAATDDLDTINGGQDNQLLILSQQANSKDVTVTEIGNINLNITDGNFTFNNTRSILTLIYDSSLGKWNEVSRAVN